MDFPVPMGKLRLCMCQKTSLVQQVTIWYLMLFKNIGLEKEAKILVQIEKREDLGLRIESP